ncbi:hypothetical protein SDRG_17385, partial [Saprolegnia diclina VS20]
MLYHGLESPQVETLKKDSAVHPIERASWWSFVSFSYMDGLVRSAAKKPLEHNDVWPLGAADSAPALMARFQQAWKATPGRFGAAIFATFRTQTLLCVSAYMVYALLTLLQPRVVKSMLQFLANDDGSARTDVGIESGYALAALLTLLSLASMSLVDFAQGFMSMLGCNAKTIVMDAVYLKSLKLANAKATSAGDLITLASVDSDRIFLAFLNGAWVPVAPLMLFLNFLLLGFELTALSAVAGAIALFVLFYVG